MTRARDLANIADGTFTATDLDLSGTLTVSGDATFDTDTLFVDVSANNVGIGTSSPTLDLSVDGSIWQGNGAGVELGRVFNDAGVWHFRASSNVTGLALGTNGTEAMRITSAGDVGIGVTPSAWNSAFDAVQIGRSTALWSQNNYDKTWLTTNVYLNSAGDFKYISTAPVSTYNQVDGTHVWAYAASGTAGATASIVEAMRIDSSGVLTNQVGAVFNENGSDVDFRIESDTNTHALFLDAGANEIGLFTSNPQSQMHFVSTDATADYAFRISYNSPTDTRYANYQYSGVDVYSADNQNNDFNLTMKGGNSAAGGGRIVLRTGSLAAGQTERMSIAQGGTIVVNETGADADFRVESDTDTHALFVDAGLGIVSTQQNGIIETKVMKKGQANASSSTAFTFDLSSDFGIGSASFYFYYEIDVGMYGNALSGPGVYKLVGGGYSLSAGNQNTVVVANNITDGSVSVSYSGDVYTVTVTNTDAFSEKYIVVRMSVVAG